MKIRLYGSALVFESAVAKEDIETLAKYDPKALTLYNEEKQPVYTIGTAAKGSVGKFGIVFDSESRTPEKLAVLTCNGADVPQENPQGFLADAYGRVVDYVNQIEAGIPAALEAVAAKKAKVSESITVEL